MKNILVFYGGKSCEHDVSVITGVLTLNSIDKSLYNPVPVYVSRSGAWYTGNALFDVSFYKNFQEKPLKKVTLTSGENALYIKGKKLKKLCDVYSAINCMHGLNGEDGSLSGLLKLHTIPLASPEIYGSSVAIDKEYTKSVLSGIGVKRLDYIKVLESNYYNNKDKTVKEIEEKLGLNVIVKPANLGSSIGISSASDKSSLEKALENGFLYDDKVIIEQKLTNFTELNCACYRGKSGVVVSQVERPVSSSEFLSFKEKYEGFKGGGEREFPAKIPLKTAEKVRQITKKVYESLDFFGIVRVDYLLCDGKIYLNEINTVPGSLAYYLFSETLKGFTDILTEIIELSVQKFSSYLSRKFDYKSSVLNLKGVKGGKLKNN